jgi:hypothetical protein
MGINMGTSFYANFEALSGNHLSKLRKPLIADALHRTGADRFTWWAGKSGDV